MDAGAEIIVQGLVQGVGFRYYVYEAARRLKVQGYVRNLPSGDVQVVVEGNRGMIEDLVRSLRAGPRAAHVNRVHITWTDVVHHFTEFEIR
ncbi:MAG: acylphosphatase [Ignavibacteriales bacterium]|nr:acylphosphatase [Ignavibacteriales bacterium]